MRPALAPSAKSALKKRGGPPDWSFAPVGGPELLQPGAPVLTKACVSSSQSGLKEEHLGRITNSGCKSATLLGVMLDLFSFEFSASWIKQARSDRRSSANRFANWELPGIHTEQEHL